MTKPEKGKPTAGEAAAGQIAAVGSGDAPPTLTDTPTAAQDPDAPEEVRVARLASYLARRQGWRGTYVVYRPDSPHEPDVEVWWVTADHTERVACSLRDGTLLVCGDAVYSHEPLTLAGGHIMGDGFCTVGVGQ